MGSIMTIRLLDNRFTFKELKNDGKNIFWRISFSAIANLKKAPITVSSDIVPAS